MKTKKKSLQHDNWTIKPNNNRKKTKKKLALKNDIIKYVLNLSTHILKLTWKEEIYAAEGEDDDLLH